MYDQTNRFKPRPLIDNKDLIELEAYFSDLEKHLNIISDIKKQQTSMKSTITAKELQAFIQVFLKGYERSLQKDVFHNTELALNSPQTYMQIFQEALSQRGISTPTQDLYIFALVDILQKKGVIAELEWKADHETTFWEISKIANKQGIRLQKAEFSPTLETHEILRCYAKGLAAQKHVLATFDIQSDSYMLYIVSESSFNKIIKLAKKAGIITKKI